MRTTLLFFVFIIFLGSPAFGMKACEDWLEGHETGLYPVSLESKNLVLRPVKSTHRDRQKMKAVFNSSDIKVAMVEAELWDGVSRKGLSRLVHRTMIGTQSTSYPGYETRELHLAIALKSDPEVIVGALVIYRYDISEKGGEKYSPEPSVSIGYSILPRYRGRGFATEVARTVALDLRRQNPERQPFLSISIDNEASLRVAEKAGYVLNSIEDFETPSGLKFTFAYYYFLAP